MWLGILVANLATNFQDLVAKVFPASRGLSQRGKMKREERDLCQPPTSYLMKPPTKFRKICFRIGLFGFLQRLIQRPLASSFHPQLWLVHLKFERALKFNSRLCSRSNLNRFSGLFHTWQKRHWLLEKRERVRDRKLVGSWQRFLSSRFILPRRQRPLLAGKPKWKI